MRILFFKIERDFSILEIKCSSIFCTAMALVLCIMHDVHCSLWLNLRSTHCGCGMPIFSLLCFNSCSSSSVCPKISSFRSFSFYCIDLFILVFPFLFNVICFDFVTRNVMFFLFAIFIEISKVIFCHIFHSQLMSSGCRILVALVLKRLWKCARLQVSR